MATKKPKQLTTQITMETHRDLARVFTEMKILDIPIFLFASYAWNFFLEKGVENIQQQIKAHKKIYDNNEKKHKYNSIRLLPDVWRKYKLLGGVLWEFELNLLDFNRFVLNEIILMEFDTGYKMKYEKLAEKIKEWYIF